MIVAIYTDDNKNTTKLINDLKKQLVGRGYTANFLTIALEKIPSDSKNPYINSVFDSNSRYRYLDKLNEYSHTKNILLVQGQIIDTVLREVKYLKNDEDINKYAKWLINYEFASYGLPWVDLYVINTKNNQSEITIKSLAKLPDFKNRIIVHSNTDKIVESILKPKVQKDYLKLNLYECLQIRANNSNLPIAIQDASKSKMANKDLEKLREKYIAKMGLNSYGAFISLPLNCITNISKVNNNVPKTHNFSTERVVETIAKESFYPENDQKITAMFLNEIKFTTFVGKIYNAQLDLIGLNKRRRLLETIINNIDGNNIGTAPFYKFEGKISFYDYLLLTNIVKLNAHWELPSAKYGYVDVGDGDKSELLEEIFDQSTFILSTSKLNKFEKSLLLGHINYFYLNLDLSNTLKLLKSGPRLKGSEYLDKFISLLIDDFSSKFPIIYEILNNEMAP